MDVAVTDDSIEVMGNLKDWSADHEIDATGLAIAPGFIDVHTHDDWAALKNPTMPFKVTQGVTTVIVGNCGASAAPFLPTAELPAPFSVINISPDDCFPTVPDYIQAVENSRPAVNVGLLVGHASLRVSTMGQDLDREATDSECATMQEMLDLAVRQGALGLSSGLDYPPPYPGRRRPGAGGSAGGHGYRSAG